MAIPPFFDALEPDAAKCIANLTRSERVEMSMAISAKRQADALDKISLALWGDDGNTGALSYLWELSQRRQS
jgi:hypothetical protein